MHKWLFWEKNVASPNTLFREHFQKKKYTFPSNVKIVMGFEKESSKHAETSNPLPAFMQIFLGTTKIFGFSDTCGSSLCKALCGFGRHTAGHFKSYLMKFYCPALLETLLAFYFQSFLYMTFCTLLHILLLLYLLQLCD